MRAPLISLAAAAVAAACVARPGTLDRSLPSGAQWTAIITPSATSALRGQVTFIRTEPGEQTRAVFALTGGTPNAVVPWHVHYGVCGDDHTIVGSSSSYPPIMLGSNGAINATAQLAIELIDRTSYVIHIHESPTDMHTVVACAALVPSRSAPIVAAR